MHWTNVRQIADVLGRANGRRGAGTLAALVAEGPAPIRSEFEDVVRQDRPRGWISPASGRRRATGPGSLSRSWSPSA